MEVTPWNGRYTTTLHEERRAFEEALLGLCRRCVSTLVQLNHAELLTQWPERVPAPLDVSRDAVGTIGGGMAKPSGKIGIAVMQSLAARAR